VLFVVVEFEAEVVDKIAEMVAVEIEPVEQK